MSQMIAFGNMRTKALVLVILIFLSAHSFADYCGLTNLREMGRIMDPNPKVNHNWSRLVPHADGFTHTEEANKYLEFRSFSIPIEMIEGDNVFTGVGNYLGDGWFITAGHVLRSRQYTDVFLKSLDDTSVLSLSSTPHLAYDTYPVEAEKDGTLENQDMSFERYSSLPNTSVRSDQLMNLILPIRRGIFDSYRPESRGLRLTTKVQIFAPDPLKVELKVFNQSAWGRALVHSPDVVLFKIQVDELQRPEVGEFLEQLTSARLVFTDLDPETKLEGFFKDFFTFNALKFFYYYDANRLNFDTELPLFGSRSVEQCVFVESQFAEITGIPKVAYGNPYQAGTSGSPAFISDSTGLPGIVGIAKSVGYLNYANVDQVRTRINDRGKIVETTEGAFANYVNLNHPYLKSWLKSFLPPEKWDQQ